MGSQKQTPDVGVVIPAINTASSTAAIRSLSAQNVKTIVVSEHDSPPAFSSKYCDERLSVPDPYIDLEAYEDALLTLARRPDVGTILPFREPDIYVLSRNRNELEAHIGTPWPTLETLRRAQDRVELFAAAEAADVSTPQTKRLENWTDWDEGSIVKPRYTVHAAEYSDEFTESEPMGKSIQYVDAGSKPDFDELVATMGHVPIVQEYVPTPDEYGFFALYDHGTPVATFQHRQRRGWKYAGGPSAYRESVDIPELETTGLRLLDELDWHGVAMVEFLRDPESGEFKLMEVNPRFWSSLPFTVQAGIDFPYLYWRQASGQAVEAQQHYEVGTAGHYLWGECLHLYSIMTAEYPLVERPSLGGTLRDIGASILRHPQFDYLDIDDPGPFVQDITNTGATVTGERLKDSVTERIFKSPNRPTGQPR